MTANITPTDPARPSLADPWIQALLQAFTEAAGPHHTLLDQTRDLPHTAYTGQLNTTTPAYVRSTVTIPGAQKARTTLHLGSLGEAQWDDAATAIAARPEAVAALLSGRPHPDLLDPAHTAGHSIVPTDITFECTAHPGGSPCRHTAVLIHAFLGRVRQQPGALLATRGCSLGRLGTKVRTALATGRATTSTIPQGAEEPQAAGPLAGHEDTTAVRADDAYNLWRATTTSIDADHTPAPAPRLPTAPPQVTPGLQSLLTDAAHRARELQSHPSAFTEHDELTDAIRHLATPTGAPLLDSVANRLGRHPADVRRLVLAHRHGGPHGVRTTDAALPADPDEVAAAATAIIQAQPTARGSLHAEDNQLTSTAAGVQLRLGPDRRWYPYTTGLTGTWQPVSGPSPDPVAAYRAARTARLARPR